MTTPTPAPVRIGLIGAGGIAGAHVAGYRRNPDIVTFAAVADPVVENAHRRGDEFGAEVYADYTTMLAEAEIDAVDICLPHHLHKDAIVAAARAGKHILCEKPLCLSVEEADEVAAAVEAAGVTLMCAHNQLFLPAVAKAKQLIDDGVLGHVYEVRTTDSFFNDFDPSTMGWRAHASTSGGGELIDTGYHPTYLLMHLAGGVPVEVTSMLSTHRLAFMEGEDSAQVLVRFDNGVVGHIVTSWAYQAADSTERFSVVGEKGSLTSDGTTLSYRLRGSDEAEILEFEPVHEFAAEIGHFAQCLIDGTRPLNTEREGIDVLGIILAAYESAANKTIAPVRHGGASVEAVAASVIETVEATQALPQGA
ncbi:Gfo/Idh/MocA family oxidoreductase [Microbacterium sp. STN6]|uniref:Gfo/Idh/MocA family protein n=1 Tax=Microbacterium sp. STN6 TaxID=2995588 RepID=UPI002260EA51|nr:Gfo/Idh/MocA family oxidoreductase [Microbacterium sp. STN6]MCX7522825.1 Gfo/Idh/MocA family oxidoreductase [Microbacterium sp. STN6]